MRTLLVNPPCDPREKTFPLGLEYIATVLRRDGYLVEGLDFSLNGRVDWPVVIENYDVVAFTTLSKTWTTVRRLISKIRPDEHRLIVVGGPHATLVPEDILTEEAVDVVILGEGEAVITAVLKAWKHGGSVRLPGVIWNTRWLTRGYVNQNRWHRLENLDDLPIPERTTFPIHSYVGMITRHTHYVPIIASRGCSRNCNHCPTNTLLPGGRKIRTPANVVDEMEMLHTKFDLSEFHFEDDSFLEDPNHVVMICNLIRKRLPGIVWQCPNGAHPSDISERLLEDMASAGCYRVYLGLETVTEKGMRTLNRFWKPEELATLTRAAKKNKIELGGYFIIGLPDESVEEIEETVEFAVNSELQWAQFSTFQHIPGSNLYDKKASGLKEGLSEETTRKLLKKAYWRFYSSKLRWSFPLQNINSHNIISLVRRAYCKLIEGKNW